jgi:hypothetical protein
MRSLGAKDGVAWLNFVAHDSLMPLEAANKMVSSGAGQCFRTAISCTSPDAAAIYIFPSHVLVRGVDGRRIGLQLSVIDGKSVRRGGDLCITSWGRDDRSKPARCMPK